MAIPDFQSLMLPLLHSLEHGSECVTQDTLDALAARLGLTEGDVTQPMPSRKAPLFTNRVAWAKLHLTCAAHSETLGGQGIMHMLSAVFLVLICLSASASAQPFGDCSSPIKTEWLADGRKMKMLEDYRYVDPFGKVWAAPMGSIVDGASIPQFLWGPVGGPFEGKYRNASVVHDVACQSRSDAWRAVHRMFLDAMRCSGVHRVRAYAMYYAVYLCGPRWGSDQGVTLCDPSRMLGLGGELSRVSILARQEPRMSVGELETLSPERLAGVEDPLTALRRALEGRAEVEETPSGVTITLPFGFDEARNANASSVAVDIGAIFLDLPVKMTVEGHTDSVGTAEYNLALGERRAESVALGISASGLDRTTLATVSMGEERPLADNVNPNTRNQNRRVVISISTEW